MKKLEPSNRRPLWSVSKAKREKEEYSVFSKFANQRNILHGIDARSTMSARPIDEPEGRGKHENRAAIMCAERGPVVSTSSPQEPVLTGDGHAAGSGKPFSPGRYLLEKRATAGIIAARKPQASW
ncbi:hypothetical protein KM043_014756 [Ampulex compressa]|nr:hypothetical protein KM043_014756 [Ampulex compressa]